MNSLASMHIWHGLESLVTLYLQAAASAADLQNPMIGCVAGFGLEMEGLVLPIPVFCVVQPCRGISFPEKHDKTMHGMNTTRLNLLRTSS